MPDHAAFAIFFLASMAPLWVLVRASRLILAARGRELGRTVVGVVVMAWAFGFLHAILFCVVTATIFAIPTINIPALLAPYAGGAQAVAGSAALLGALYMADRRGRITGDA